MPNALLWKFKRLFLWTYGNTCSHTFCTSYKRTQVFVNTLYIILWSKVNLSHIKSRHILKIPRNYVYIVVLFKGHSLCKKTYIISGNSYEAFCHWNNKHDYYYICIKYSVVNVNSINILLPLKNLIKNTSKHALRGYKEN